MVGKRPILLGHTPALRHLNVRTFRPGVVRNGTVRLRPLTYATFGTSFSNSRVTIRLPLDGRTVLRTRVLVLRSRGVLGPTGNTPVAMPTRSVMLNLCCVAGLHAKTGKRNLAFCNPRRTLVTCGRNGISVRTPIGMVMGSISRGNGVVSIVHRASIKHIVIGRVIPPRTNCVGAVVSGGSLHSVVDSMVGMYNITGTTSFLSKVGGLNCRVTFGNNLSFGLNSVVVPGRGRMLIRGNCSRMRRIVGGCGVNFVAGGRHCGRIVSV